MKKPSLDSARIFIAVIEKGSFTAAARELNVPLTTVSRKVSELEKELGIRLLERTTRKLRSTEAGDILYHSFVRAYEEINIGFDTLIDNEQALRGRIKISMPPCFQIVWPLLKGFKAIYPNIEIDSLVTTEKLDLVANGIDVAFRVGDINNLSHVVRRLTSYRHKLVASRGISQVHDLSELYHQPCIAWGNPGSNIHWNLGGEKIRIEPKEISNDYFQLKYNLINGKYITELPPFLCADELRQGELVEVLPNSPLPLFDVTLLYPSRKQLPRLTRLFIDYCVDYFHQLNQESPQRDM
ncbi:LysR substrate-binding domain-containing protein [Vibrio mediterranei]|jgi:DNA-binding transcriptional LysR family regulator|uniref:LysR family transcriptional regulator n=1 Tax=Vibrio mediterranei TaxID=689 RepID=UPI001EFD170C|nr:LysR family transcriptional regulator [Vibrio mediterranei]MCG9628658.1 LysR substrate-binding domain-containing protein [Vibrio mediterranei]MCY9856159.1 LysR substrate-binding domain-containing protein [Vibrio mediterranei]